MKIYPAEITSDDKGRVLKVLLTNGENWYVKGECLRCGKCCTRADCPSFGHESLNGKLIAKCNAQWSKPWRCKIWPTNPYDSKEMPDGCGYRWSR